MELSLTPELETLIAKKLATGKYTDAEQIIVEALKKSVTIDDQRDQALDALKKMIAEGDEGATARSWLREQQQNW